jgi:hypothetical protein
MSRRGRGDPFGWADAVEQQPPAGRGDAARGDRGRPPGPDAAPPDEWRGNGNDRSGNRSVRETGTWGRPPRRR